MPIDTRLNALLGIRHPILLAPMDVVAGARLTLAVSNAGGFGVLGGGYGEKAWLEQETGSLKQQAWAPFGIGFITWSLSRQPWRSWRWIAAPIFWLRRAPRPAGRALRAARSTLCRPLSTSAPA